VCLRICIYVRLCVYVYFNVLHLLYVYCTSVLYINGKAHSDFKGECEHACEYVYKGECECECDVSE